MDEFLSIPTVPPRYRGCTFDNFKAATAKQRAAVAGLRASVGMLCEEGVGPLILCGPPGTGKTHLGVSLLLAEAATDDPASRDEYVFASGLELSQQWARGAKPYKLLDELADAWLLLIDDLMPPASQAEQEALMHLIDKRCTGHMPPRLVITTNMAPPEFRQYLGGRAADRVREGSQVFALDGASHRQPLTPARLAELRRQRDADDA